MSIHNFGVVVSIVPSHFIDKFPLIFLHFSWVCLHLQPHRSEVRLSEYTTARINLPMVDGMKQRSLGFCPNLPLQIQSHIYHEHPVVHERITVWCCWLSPSFARHHVQLNPSSEQVVFPASDTDGSDSDDSDSEKSIDNRGCITFPTYLVSKPDALERQFIAGTTQWSR